MQKHILNRDEFINEWKINYNDDKSLTLIPQSKDVNPNSNISKEEQKVISNGLNKLLYNNAILLNKISGRYEKGFDSKIRKILNKNKSIIEWNKESNENNTFPSTEEDKYVDIKNKHNWINTLFSTYQHGNPAIGKGEALLAGYYNNVYKTPASSNDGGEPGDDYFDENGTRKYIEVKSAGAEFKDYDGDYDENKFKNIDKTLVSCALSIASYMHGMKKSKLFKNPEKNIIKELYLVVFDNEFKRGGEETGNEITGYIQIKRKNNLEETALSILKFLMISTEKSTKANKTKGFAISINKKDKKIEVHLRDKD